MNRFSFNFCRVVLLAIFCYSVFWPQMGFCADPVTGDKNIAITIDDFPSVGPRSRPISENIRLLSEALSGKKIPATGFIVGERSSLGDMKIWLDSGFQVGNHTFSHPFYSKCSIQSYFGNIEKNVRVVKESLGIDLKGSFFRFPYLDHGDTEEKVAAMESFLKKTGGKLAHVSLDTIDYEFALFYAKKNKSQVAEMYLRHLGECAKHSDELSRRLFGRGIPLILLIHANELNGDCLPKALDLFKSMGYTFISLETAVADPAYQPFLYLPPMVRCKGDRNFLNQIALSKGIKAIDPTGSPWFKQVWKPLLEALPDQ